MKSRTHFWSSILRFWLVILARTSLVASETWEYGHGPHGFEHWPGECSVGSAQSPIDIPDRTVTKEQNSYEKFVFNGYDVEHELTILNNGHTLKFEANPAKRAKDHPKSTAMAPTVFRGGLPASSFEFVQGHFHWGSINTQGSEHTINTVAYPMELHLVHFNRDKGSTLQEAIANFNYNSLAVLGIMFEVGVKPNHNFDKLFEAMKKVKNQEEKTEVGMMNLSSLLPRNTDRFYRYNGSLTTPGCHEIVVWTVFKEPVPISQEQMDVLREITFGTEEHVKPLMDNFRPVLERNSRVVLDVDTSEKLFTASSAVPTSLTNFKLSSTFAQTLLMIVVSLLIWN